MTPSPLRLIGSGLDLIMADPDAIIPVGIRFLSGPGELKIELELNSSMGLKGKERRRR